MTDLEKELSQYSIDELNLILETQRDLYTVEELKIIKAELKKKEDVEKQKIIDRLPKEIKCPKCEMENPFENDKCMYCQYEFDKSKYYDDEYYEDFDEDEETEESYLFQYMVSFLIPLIGFILGVCLLSKDNATDKSIGKTCIIIGIASMIIFGILGIVVFL